MTRRLTCRTMPRRTVIQRMVGFAALLLVAIPAGAEPVVPWATGHSRRGIPIVAVGAPGAPWGVVQLHIRIGDGDIPPVERQSLQAAVAALADGAVAGRARTISADVLDAGGTTRWRTGPDHAVIADGAPMDRFSVLLRALDERLRARGRIMPATRSLELEKSLDPLIDPEALALAAPGHPLALPTTGGSVEPQALRAALDRALRRERVAISVVGPLPPAELLALVYRSLGAPLPAGAPPASLSIDPVAGTRLAETTHDHVETRSTVWLVGPGRGSVGAAPADRAARSVLARLVGGRVEGTNGLFAIALDVDSPKASASPRAEGAKLRSVLDLSRTPPTAEAVERARQAERTERLERLTDPAAIADALGRALLAGDPALVDQELDALLAVDVAAVTQAAQAAATGPRIVVRRLGSAR